MGPKHFVSIVDNYGVNLYEVSPWLACPAEREGPRSPVYSLKCTNRENEVPRSSRGTTSLIITHRAFLLKLPRRFEDVSDIVFSLPANL